MAEVSSSAADTEAAKPALWSAALGGDVEPKWPVADGAAAGPVEPLEPLCPPAKAGPGCNLSSAAAGRPVRVLKVKCIMV